MVRGCRPSKEEMDVRATTVIGGLESVYLSHAFDTTMASFEEVA